MANFNIEIKHCKNCGKETEHFKNRPNHILHLILMCCSCGLWGIVWVLVSASSSWKCRTCGKIPSVSPLAAGLIIIVSLIVIVNVCSSALNGGSDSVETAAKEYTTSINGDMINEFGEKEGTYTGFESTNSKVQIIMFSNGEMKFDKVPYLGLLEDDCKKLKIKDNTTGDVLVTTKGYFYNFGNKSLVITGPKTKAKIKSMFKNGANISVVFYRFDNNTELVTFTAK